MDVQLTTQVEALVARLVALDPKPASIWMIGSRANGRATQASDTDLIVFGTMALIEAARAQLAPPLAVDCLVVFDENNFLDPWQKKSGSLEGFTWQRVSEKLATYVGTKWIPDEEMASKGNANLGTLAKRKEQAVRIWP